MKHRSLFLPFLTLLSCNTAFPRNPEHHSLNATPTEIQLGGMSPSESKDGQVVSSMASKAFGYRYPQVPLEVDGYVVAPHNLQLEQVHIYVRHGAFLKIKGQPIFGFIHCYRGTYTGWCASRKTASIHSRTLENV